jgi:hypothetical protein
MYTKQVDIIAHLRQLRPHADESLRALIDTALTTKPSESTLNHIYLGILDASVSLQFQACISSPGAKLSTLIQNTNAKLKLLENKDFP